MVNVVLPLLILRLAAGKRPYSVRALMALPLAAAIPLMTFLVLEPVLPVGSGLLIASEQRLFITGTAAGLPIVLSLLLVFFSLVKGRPRPLAILAGLSIVASSAIAAIWIAFDMRSMPAIEHFGRAGWYLVVLPGAYAASVLFLLGWLIQTTIARVRRRRLQRAHATHTRSS